MQHVDFCRDHISEGVCPTCGRQDLVMAYLRCSICKQNVGVPIGGLIRLHPVVISLFYEQGISLTYDAGSTENRRVGGLDPSPQITEDLVSEDPPRVRMTIEYDGEELQLTLNEHLDVTDVQRA